MTALPLHAIPGLLDAQVRLRVYRGPRLEMEMPLRPRQALALAALLLNRRMPPLSAWRFPTYAPAGAV
jgi:hypothetical protein